MKAARKSRCAPIAAFLVAAWSSSGCGPSPAKPQKPPTVQEASSQIGYCERLQPRLDEAGQRVAIGSQLVCLDLPGITELGRFGPSEVPEEGDLAACFDTPSAFEEVVEQRSEKFNLTLEQSFSVAEGAHAKSRLSALVPWIPDLAGALDRAAVIDARVTIREARFVTLVEVASALQSQERAPDCLRALCATDYRFIHKALVGIPTATLTARNEQGHTLELDAAVVAGGWNARRAGKNAVALSSERPVTIAVARSGFRTPYTEPLCAECGEQEQRCCIVGEACGPNLACQEGQCVAAGEPGQPCHGGECQDGASCIDDQCVSTGDTGQPCDQGECHRGAACQDGVCVPAGSAGQPCDHGHCREGASCVGGVCQKHCGGPGESCCREARCGPGLSCSATEPEEVRVSSERVDLDGGLFGVSQDRLFGKASCGKERVRTRFAARKIAGDGSCKRTWWFAPEHEEDCRVGAHLTVPTFGDLECVIEVYSRKIPEEKCQR